MGIHWRKLVSSLICWEKCWTDPANAGKMPGKISSRMFPTLIFPIHIPPGYHKLFCPIWVRCLRKAKCKPMCAPPSNGAGSMILAPQCSRWTAGALGKGGEGQLPGATRSPQMKCLAWRSGLRSPLGWWRRAKHCRPQGVTVAWGTAASPAT